MRSDISISVVLPFYNEEEYIPHALKTIALTIADKINGEIILIDDGSIDRSAEIARKQATLFKNVKIVTLEKNQGLGAALRAGFAASTKDYILYTDIDLPFDFSKEFWEILRAGIGQDLTFGQRIKRNESFKRRVYSKVFNSFIRGLFSIENNDINFAMKLIRREKLEKITLHSKGSFIDCELYLKFLFSGCQMKPIDLHYQDRIYGTSRLGNIKNILKIGIEFIWIFPEIYRMSQGYKLKNQNQA